MCRGAAKKYREPLAMICDVVGGHWPLKCVEEKDAGQASSETPIISLTNQNLLSSLYNKAFNSNALLYKGSNSQPQLPHSLSACLIAEISTALSPFPSNHACAGRDIKSQPDATNFPIIVLSSSINIPLSNS
jgi:hypothetical protein